MLFMEYYRKILFLVTLIFHLNFRKRYLIFSLIIHFEITIIKNQFKLFIIVVIKNYQLLNLINWLNRRG